MGFSSAMMSGVSGLLNNAQALNVIGNNISNANTVGFKAGRVLFADMLSVPVTGTGSQVGLGSKLTAVETLFTQGSPLNSENPTDLAISGNGFFVVQENSNPAATAYTRAGTFHPDENGRYLVNPSGAKLCDATGTPVDLAALPDFFQISRIETDGSITYTDTSGAPRVSTIQIGIATFDNPLGLEKLGDNLYATSAMSGAATLGKPDRNNKLLSNTLEQSNVDMSTEMVNLIISQRAYSANSKTILTSDEMTQDVINLKR